MVKEKIKKWLGISEIEKRFDDIVSDIRMKDDNVSEKQKFLTVPADVIGEWLNGCGHNQ